MNDLNEMDIAIAEERMLASDERTAEEIAGSINRIKAEVREAVLDGSIRIGRELQAAKSKVPYGEWESWLEANVAYSVRTAQNLMRIADEYGRRRTEAMEGLSITQAVLLLGLTAQEREAFVESHDMESITTDELREQIKQLNEEKAKLQMTIEDMLRDTQQPEEDQQELRAQLEEAERQLEEATRKKDKLYDELKAAETSHDIDRKKHAEELRKAQQEAAEQGTKATAAKKTVEGLTRQKERLEEELLAERQKPAQVVYQTPPDVLEEMKKLRESAGRSNDETALRTMYEALVNGFTRLQEQLGIVRSKDPELGNKMTQAVRGGLLKMAEVVQG